MNEALAHRLLDRHGVDGSLDRAPRGGNVCYAFFTAEVVLKVPRRGFEGSAVREAFAGPAAKAAGVATADLVAFDASRELVPTPYTVWTRVPGGAPEPGAHVWAEVGAQIAALHRGVPSGGERQIYRDGTSRETLKNPGVEQTLRGRQLYGPVSRWALKLEAWRDRSCPDRFLHADVHRTNVLVADGRLSALVDWGDAGWGDPAYDLSRAPCEALPRLFDAYFAAGGADLGEHARGRILRYRLARILRWMKAGRQEGADLEELLSFAAAPPDAWAPYGF
jgi:aminoglycoside phosphotransferase (APT) family kinase protein